MTSIMLYRQSYHIVQHGKAGVNCIFYKVKPGMADNEKEKSKQA